MTAGLVRIRASAVLGEDLVQAGDGWFESLAGDGGIGGIVGREPGSGWLEGLREKAGLGCEEGLLLGYYRRGGRLG